MINIPDIEQELYEGCKAEVQDLLPGTEVVNAFEEYAGSGLHVQVMETGNTDYVPARDSAGPGNYARLQYTALAIAGDGSAAQRKAQAKAAMEAVCSYFDATGFVRTGWQPSYDPGQPDQYRITASFEAVIDKNRRLYTFKEEL